MEHPIDRILNELETDILTLRATPGLVGTPFGKQRQKKFDEALTAIYEIGLEVIGADEDVTEAFLQHRDGRNERIARYCRNELRASQRKAWAKACGVAE